MHVLSEIGSNTNNVTDSEKILEKEYSDFMTMVKREGSAADDQLVHANSAKKFKLGSNLLGVELFRKSNYEAQVMAPHLAPGQDFPLQDQPLFDVNGAPLPPQVQGQPPLAAGAASGPVPVTYLPPGGQGHYIGQGSMSQVLVDANGVPTGTLVPSTAPQTTVFSGHQHPQPPRQLPGQPPLPQAAASHLHQPPPGSMEVLGMPGHFVLPPPGAGVPPGLMPAQDSLPPNPSAIHRHGAAMNPSAMPPNAMMNASAIPQNAVMAAFPPTGTPPPDGRVRSLSMSSATSSLHSMHSNNSGTNTPDLKTRTGTPDFKREIMDSTKGGWLFYLL